MCAGCKQHPDRDYSERPEDGCLTCLNQWLYRRNLEQMKLHFGVGVDNDEPD